MRISPFAQRAAALLGEESDLQTAVASVSQPADAMDPTGALLAQCRSELAEKLDDLEMPQVREHWMPFGWVRRWMALRPAWSAAGLIVFGVAIGTQLMPWLAVRSGGGDDGGTAQAMNVMATPRLTDENLSKMAVAGITFSPAPDAAPGTLQLQVTNRAAADGCRQCGQRRCAPGADFRGRERRPL